MEMHDNSTIQSPLHFSRLSLSLFLSICLYLKMSVVLFLLQPTTLSLTKCPSLYQKCLVELVSASPSPLSSFPHFLACLPACQLLRSSIPRPPISFDFSAAFLRSSCLVFSPRFSHSSGSISISCLSVFSLPPSLPCLISYEIAPFSLSVFNRYINIRF